MKRTFYLFLCMTFVSYGGMISAAELKEGHEEAGHHEHSAPHNGTLVELGDEFAHVELVLDSDGGILTAYVLDGEAEEAVRIAQSDIQLDIELGHDEGGDEEFKVILQGKENSLTGETVGDTSEFSGQSDRLKGVKEFEAEIVHLTIKGQELNNVEFNFPKGNEEE